MSTRARVIADQEAKAASTEARQDERIDVRMPPPLAKAISDEALRAGLPRNRLIVAVLRDAFDEARR